jgi:hypothetical protein
MHWLERDWPKCVAHWKGRRLGIFLDGCSFLWRLWVGFLREDVADLAKGRLVINATRLRGLSARPWLLTAFHSKQQLLQALLAGTGIPAISLLRFWLRVGDDCCCDGAFTCLAPQLAAGTVLLSPFRKFQPTGFKFVIAPTKSKSVRVVAPRAAGGPIGSASAIVNVCFKAPSMEACYTDARRGYEDARAARETLVAAGWVPISHALANRFAWPKECVQ